MKIFIIIWFLALSIGILLLCIVQNDTLYNYFFNRKEYNIFKELNETPIKEFTVIDKEWKYFKVKSHPNWEIVVFNHGAAVFERLSNDCLASTFYKKGSTKLANKLMQLL